MQVKPKNETEDKKETVKATVWKVKCRDRYRSTSGTISRRPPLPSPRRTSRLLVTKPRYPPMIASRSTAALEK